MDPLVLLTHRVINEQTECWEFTGSRNDRGYGRLSVNGKQWRAHRLAAVLWLGFDPASGLQVLHHCDNPCCINPEHLFIGTVSDNMRDMISKGRVRGRSVKEERNGSAKLTRDQVLEIRQRLAERVPVLHIARIFGVGHETIRRIRDGVTWREVR